MTDTEKWELVAIKRRWVPEWLWSLMCADLWILPSGIALYQPFRWFLTKRASPPMTDTSTDLKAIRERCANASMECRDNPVLVDMRELLALLDEAREHLKDCISRCNDMARRKDEDALSRFGTMEDQIHLSDWENFLARLEGK